MSYLNVSERELVDYQHFTATPTSGALGATIEGIDLNTELSEDAFNELYQAFLEFKVLFFRNQAMTPEQHIDFSRRFGSLERLERPKTAHGLIWR